ncbi:MAG: hypothetical protein R3C25_05890 [Hyphomonadaceae bacterium]
MRSVAAILAALCLASCASAPDLVSTRERLARRIADDAAGFNEAYAQAVSAQILLNVLRSRDRLPRYYLAMTGISDTPSWRYQQTLGVGSVPLGEGASPWGVGNAGVQRETQSRPAYAVQPFSADVLTRTAFQPTPPDVFEHYWRSGWPRDLLMLVMVESIEVSEGGARPQVYTNEANTIFDDCQGSVETEGCAFVREMRAVLAVLDQAPAEGAADSENGRPVCGLIEAVTPAAPVRRVAQGSDCDPAFAVGASTLRLRLRSLDDMIYYVGELMRAGSMRAESGEAIEAQVTVHAAGLRGGGRGVPLFRIVPAQSAAGGIYAAEVQYGGARYRAGPAIGRSCGRASSDGLCRDSAETGDRSSSVLSLIAEILALNQSPDAIRAPNRFISD